MASEYDDPHYNPHSSEHYELKEHKNHHENHHHNHSGEHGEGGEHHGHDEVPTFVLLNDPPRLRPVVLQEAEMDPSMRRRASGTLNILSESHKRVGWDELMFDLIFIAFLGNVSHLVVSATYLSLEGGDVCGTAAASAHSVGPHLFSLKSLFSSASIQALDVGEGGNHVEYPVFGMSEANHYMLGYFVYLHAGFQIWFQWATRRSALDGNGDLIGRCLMLGLISASMAMAASVDGGVAVADNFSTFAMDFGIAKIWLALGSLRIYANIAQIRPYLVHSLARESSCALLAFISAFLPNDDMETKVVLFIISLWLSEIWTFIQWKLKRDIARLVRVHPAHFSERMGIFTIICLGEAAIQIINAGATSIQYDAPDARIVGGILSFFPVLVVWFLYFDNLEEKLLGKHIERLWLWFVAAHFTLVVGLSAFAGGIAASIQSWACNGAFDDLPDKAVGHICIAFSLCTVATDGLRGMSIHVNSLAYQDMRGRTYQQFKKDIWSTSKRLAFTSLLTFLCLTTMAMWFDWSPLPLLLVLSFISVGKIILDHMLGRRREAEKRRALRKTAMRANHNHFHDNQNNNHDHHDDEKQSINADLLDCSSSSDASLNTNNRINNNHQKSNVINNDNNDDDDDTDDVRSSVIHHKTASTTSNGYMQQFDE